MTQAKQRLAAAKAALAQQAANVRFLSLSPKEQRVAIAKDVIAAMDAEAFHVETGTYCDIGVAEERDGESLQDILQYEKPPCYVCGIGAMFLGFVRKGNSVEVGDVPDSFEGISETLDGIFSEAQLADIELAFERGMVDNGSRSDSRESLGEAWGEKYPSDSDRLRAICKNIIRNDGTFKLREVKAPRG